MMFSARSEYHKYSFRAFLSQKNMSGFYFILRIGVAELRFALTCAQRNAPNMTAAVKTSLGIGAVLSAQHSHQG